MVKKISEKEFRQETEKGICVVDFSAQWCGPCHMMEPVLEQISEELVGKIRFFNVDMDQNMSLAQEYMITNIPALLVLKDGKKEGMLVGFMPKEELKKELEVYLA